MARRSSEEFKRGAEAGSSSMLISEIIGMAIIPVFLLIAASVFWLTDRLNSNFASSVAQDKSNFLPFLLGAVVVAVVAAVWLSRKYGSRCKRENRDELEQEAEEFQQSRKRKPVRK